MRKRSRLQGLRKGVQDASRAVGPNPTDRGKPGTKCHLVVDRRGTPLAFSLSGAIVHDSRGFDELIDAIWSVCGRRGRPRKRSAKLHADKGYDYPRCRSAPTRRRIKVRIARRGVESSERLGRHRWVVERALAWLNRFRRLKVRFERRAEIHDAFVRLRGTLITWGAIQRFC